MKKVFPSQSDKLKSSLSELKNNEKETWRSAKFDNDLNNPTNDIPLNTESNEEMLNNESNNASLEEKIKQFDKLENKKNPRSSLRKSNFRKEFTRSKTLVDDKIPIESKNHPTFSIFPRQQNMSFNFNPAIKNFNQSSSLRIEEDSYSYEEESELSSENDQAKLQWEKSYFLANVALHFENYKEGIKYIDEMILLCDDQLNSDQIRVFLGINFGYINELRNTHKKILNLILTENKGKQLYFEIKDEKEQLILKRSERIIRIINEHILNKKLDNESVARMYKVKADFYRYMAEITTGHQLFLNKQNAFNFYNSAKELTKDLDDLNPVKLNISLNYSVFLDEILNLRMNSYFYAKEALFNALKALKNCKEEELTSEGMRDTLMIIESLNTNVEDWYKEEVGDIFDEDSRKLREKEERDERKREELEKKLEFEKIKEEEEEKNEKNRFDFIKNKLKIDNKVFMEEDSQINSDRNNNQIMNIKPLSMSGVFKKTNTININGFYKGESKSRKSLTKESNFFKLNEKQ